MKTTDQNPQVNNQPKGNNNKQQQVDQPRTNNNNTGKKSTYIKDMPPIDGARPGVI